MSSVSRALVDANNDANNTPKVTIGLVSTWLGDAKSMVHDRGTAKLGAPMVDTGVFVPVVVTGVAIMVGQPLGNFGWPRGVYN